MAWEARLGLKHPFTGMISPPYARLNGLGSPFGFETQPAAGSSGRCSRATDLGREK